MTALAPNPAMDVTRLLKAWNAGDERAQQALIALVYDELRHIARYHLRGERSDHTLQPTAVVHEAYARLAQGRIEWHDRKHFFTVATTLMRRILVDHARARMTAKREHGASDPTFEAIETQLGTVRSLELVAIDTALGRLEALDPRKAQLVQLRFFGGLSIEETAELMGCSRAAVVREWRMARAWLYREIGR